MMSHFHQSCNNINIMTILSSSFFVIFFFLETTAIVDARHDEFNTLVELSSTADLIQMAGYGEEKISTVVVDGTVFCDTCSDKNSPPQPHPIPGASVAVSCHTSRKTRKSNWVQGETDNYGEFLLDIPSHLHAIQNLEKRCHVKILQLPTSSPCHRAFTGKSKGIKLSSLENENGIRTYTTQGIHLIPRYKQDCMNKRNRGKKSVYVP